MPGLGHDLTLFGIGCDDRQTVPCLPPAVTAALMLAIVALGVSGLGVAWSRASALRREQP